MAAAALTSAAPDPAVVRAATTWACAEPVHLVIGVDHLRLAPTLDPPLDVEECAELQHDRQRCDRTSRRQAGSPSTDADGCCLPGRDPVRDPGTGGGFGRDIRDLMPLGRDGRAVRRLMNELQMVLHEHPVGTRRAARDYRTPTPSGSGASERFAPLST
jgi:hypothetical protein